MRIFGILMVFLLLPNVVLVAQSDSDWDIVVYSHQDNALYQINADGVGDVLLLMPDMSDYERPQYYATSTDEKYFAYGTFEQTLNDDGWFDYDSTVYIANLETWECCDVVNVDDPFPDDEIIYSVLAFSPDNSQLILRVTTIPTDGESSQGQGSSIVIIIDSVSGAIHHEIRWAVNQEVVSWTDSGILFREICNGFNCGGADNPPSYLLWEPSSEKSESYVPPRFPLQIFQTDETLQVIQLEAQGTNCCRFALEYRSSDMDSAYNIYTDVEAHLYAFQSYWVANGRYAVLLPLSNNVDTTRFEREGLLISRDGSERQFPYPIGSAWVATTPDGWLATNNLRNQLIYYRIDDDLSVFKAQIDVPHGISFTERTIIRKPEIKVNSDELIAFPSISDMP